MPFALTLIGNGLDGRDNFERPVSNTVGGPPGEAVWTEKETGPTIIQVADDAGNGIISFSTGLGQTQYVFRDLVRVLSGLDFLAQFNLRTSVGDPGPGDSNQLRAGSDNPSLTQHGDNAYLLVIRKFDDDFLLINRTATVDVTIGSVPLTVVGSEIWQLRLEGRFSGGNYALKAYATGPLGLLTDVTTTPVLKITVPSDAAPTLGKFVEIVTFNTGIDGDEQIQCGMDIVVTNMPAGHKIQVGSLPIVTEVGGIATVPIDGLPIPQPDIKLLDPADAVLDTLTQDTYGGATASVSLGAPNLPTNLACVCQVTVFGIDLAWTDQSSDEDGFNIFRRINGSGASFVQIDQVVADIVIYQDRGQGSPLEPNTCYDYQVTAFNLAGESLPSNTATCKSPTWTDCVEVPDCEDCP